MGSLSIVFCAIGLLLFGLAACEASDGKSCRFPAIYNFGDSNSDTGGRSAALGFTELPYGRTFFGKPAGRASDGRLIIDFITQNLGLPYLSAYLDAIGTSFRRGANFATGGSSIKPGGYSPFHLDLQIAQFIQFKSRTNNLYNEITTNSNNTGKDISCKTSSLPRPNEFSKALYTFDIGQNDLSLGFQHSSPEQVRDSIPEMIDMFSHSLHQLYGDGARIFWVHNTGPHGCMPNSVFYNRNNPKNFFDSVGCVKSQNEVATEFNRQLKERVSQLRTQLSQAAITYVDVYSAKYSLISNAKNLGFGDPLKVCCGSYEGGVHINCGKTYTPNGTVYGPICADPSKRISWDGIHYTDAADAYLAKVIVSGSVSDPKISISDSCRAVTNM